MRRSEAYVPVVCIAPPSPPSTRRVTRGCVARTTCASGSESAPRPMFVQASASAAARQSSARRPTPGALRCRVDALRHEGRRGGAYKEGGRGQRRVERQLAFPMLSPPPLHLSSSTSSLFSVLVLTAPSSLVPSSRAPDPPAPLFPCRPGDEEEEEKGREKGRERETPKMDGWRPPRRERGVGQRGGEGSGEEDGDERVEGDDGGEGDDGEWLSWLGLD
eukprot:scaffold170310_cov28-Tisochrysis_lutea.AAC.1